MGGEIAVSPEAETVRRAAEPKAMVVGSICWLNSVAAAAVS